jgi:hypothetical protein
MHGKQGISIGAMILQRVNGIWNASTSPSKVVFVPHVQKVFSLSSSPPIDQEGGPANR